ncbi:RsiV family protein [Belliella kenyensis]|uniref:RsiV family protein n=1 Tax=Belliella kenyensis TaxID=1472724 RepID=A0ABV8EHF2_9BACT|nr:RsiV family protein [Belliella kenyensis]MCH7403449.1 RsiV family protein [Belliella kenyensis]MDN3602349.1 RsiV family protein [Belliella kenyensis]
MKNKLNLFLILGLILSACQSSENLSPLASEQREYAVEECHKDTCAKLDLSYVYYTGDSEVDSMVNFRIDQIMTNFVSFEEPAESLALAVDHFFQEFNSYIQDFEHGVGWFHEIMAHEDYQSDQVLTVTVRGTSFLGGAHPNSFPRILNFNRQTGDLISNDDLVLNQEALLAKVEEKFRDYHDVAKEVSLNEDGRFFLKDDKFFFLPANMGFCEDGFCLVYSSYEIGPYVLGETSLVLTWDELDGLVRTVFEK